MNKESYLSPGFGEERLADGSNRVKSVHIGNGGGDQSGPLIQ